MIEVDGDVSVPGKSQQELKLYGSEDPLTSGDLNIWNTLKNWMDDRFEDAQYASLVLRTTQPHGVKSEFKVWNDANLEARLAILEKVIKNAEAKLKDQSSPSDAVRLMRVVMDSSKSERLARIAVKFHIAALAPDLDETYRSLIRQRSTHIPKMNEDAFWDQMAGFIIRPSIVQSNRWLITYAEFKQQCENAASAHVHGQKRFPTKYIVSYGAPLTSDQMALRNHDFARKIEAIDYADKIPSAIKDYWYAWNTVLEDFQSYKVERPEYDRYSDDVEREFVESRGTAKRIPTACSKDFYDQVTSAQPPPFQGYIDSRKDFRNGVLHMHMNDTAKPHKWNLND